MGKVIISFDFEIGWGDITNGVWKRREANEVYKRLRRILPKMLRTMDDCDFYATWATVGAMIEPPSSRDFSHLTTDQLSTVEDALRNSDSSTFDGADLFESVLSSRVAHQIACHSYTHIPFDYPGVDGRFVREDLSRFNETLSSYSLSTNSLVFPENTEGFYPDVMAAGFEKVRVTPNHIFKNRYLYLSTLMFVPPPNSKEEVHSSGLSRHYGSMLFNDVGKSYRIPILERRVSLGLDNVVNKDHDLHIWAHPFNFAESDALLHSFNRTVKKIAALRDEGKLSIGLM